MNRLLSAIRYQPSAISHPLRVGFVGCGRHATTNLYPALRHAPAELVAVCARHRDHAERTARQFGARHAYEGWRAMLDSGGLDAVLVCGDPALHAEVAAEALRRGLAVWVEKPPAPTAAEAETLAQVAREAGRPLAVGFQKRFAPAYVAAARRARRWGDLAHVGITFAVGPARPDEFRRDIAIHALDLARLFGGEVARLTFERHEDGNGVTWAVALRFASGAVGTLTLSNQRGWGQPNERVELTARGRRSPLGGGWLVVDNLTRLTIYPRDDTHPGFVPGDRALPRVWEPNLTVPTAEMGSLFLQGYVGELRAFAEAALDGRAVSPDIADGMAALRLVEALGGPAGRVVEMGRRNAHDTP